jgi:biofilm protein TabA
MILGDSRHYAEEKQMYASSIRKGIEHILNGSLSALEPGNYEIEGHFMFAMVQEMCTQPAEEMRLESHCTYVDIQFLVSGEESMGVVKHSAALQVEEDCLAERDVIFYKHSGAGQESTIVLKPGQFVVFSPSDVHRPGCCVGEPGSIKKIVIKIHKQLWHQDSGLSIADK